MLVSNHRWRYLFVVILGLLLASCAEKVITSENITEFVQPESPQPESPQPESPPAKDYLLGIEDVLKIEFYYNPSLNRQLTIRPDGKITLPLKGEVTAAGLTPNELKDKILALFSDVLKDPVVTVSVEGVKKHNKVYILGEVLKPDYYALDSPTTVTQLLARSGVRTETANLDTVLVISRNDAGKPAGKLVNVNKILSEANLDQDLLLKSYDIVYVSKTTIATVDLFVDQYINGLVPNFFRVGYGINHTTVSQD